MEKVEGAGGGGSICGGEHGVREREEGREGAWVKGKNGREKEEHWNSIRTF